MQKTGKDIKTEMMTNGRKLYGNRISTFWYGAIMIMLIIWLTLGARGLSFITVFAQGVSTNEPAETTVETCDEILEAETAAIKYSGTDGDLSWSIDEEGHLEISGTGDYETRDMGDYTSDCWLEYKEEILTATVNVTGITDTSYMFHECSNLMSLDLGGLDTSAVTDMNNMFSDCSSLMNLDLSGFDTGAVTSMWAMFWGCRKLTSLDLSGLDTNFVTDMGGMFNGCSSLTNLDVSKFDTSVVTYMSYMFKGCSSLSSLDVSSFDTSSVIEMKNMFSGCSSLKELDLSGFNMSAEMNNYMMFSDCMNLSLLKLPPRITIDVVLPYYCILNERTSNYLFQESFSWKDANGITQQYAIKNLSTPMIYKRVMVPFVLGEKESPTTQPQGTILKSADITSKTDSIPANVSFTVTSSDPKNPTVAFDGVNDVNAKEVKIPSTIIYDGVEYKVTTVSPTAFQTQKDHASFEVTDNRVESLTVAYKAPTNKKKAKVTIPQYSTYRGIKFKVTSVSAKSFRNNKKVTQVSIATSITKIGDSCFEGCINLKSVTIGKSLKTIGKNAFKNCKKLTKITIKSAKLQSVGKNALKGVNAKCKIKVPKKQVKKYKKLFAKKGQKSSVKVVQ